MPVAVNSITCMLNVKYALKCFAGQRPDGSMLCKTELEMKFLWGLSVLQHGPPWPCHTTAP